MSPAAVVLGALLLATLCWVAVLRRQQARVDTALLRPTRASDAVPLRYADRLFQPGMVTDREVPLDALEARVVDPDNPPGWLTYRPRRPEASEALCTCHGLPIRPGESVLVWPIPGHPEGGRDVFCHRTVGRP